MNDSAMNPPESHSSAVTPRVPDYKPRNRLDPTWRPGTSVRSKMASRASAEVVDDPWMYSQRSLREHRRLMPAQRTVLWLLLAAGMAAAGLVGLGMGGGDDEGQHGPASAAHAGRQEGAGLPALRPPSRPATVLADLPQASPPVMDATTGPVATPSVHEDAGNARTGPAVAGGPAPAATVTHAGMRLAPALSVTPVLAEQAPAAVAQVQANLLPSAARPGDDDARRARRPQAEAKSVECNQAQQAMQLCDIAAPASR